MVDIKKVVRLALMSSVLWKVGAMENNENKINESKKELQQSDTFNNKNEIGNENQNSIVIQKESNKHSKLFDCVSLANEWCLQGFDIYKHLNFFNMLRNDPCCIKKYTENQYEINKILSDINDIFEFRRFLPIKDLNEVYNENKLDELIEKDVNYLNSVIFNNKFFYNFNDNIFDKIEIATTFRVFVNIFKNFNSIKNIFKDVFEKDLYFILCDRTANDKSLLNLINRKLKKYEKIPETFKNFDKNSNEFDFDISNETNSFTVGFDVFLVMSLYDCSRDKNYKLKKEFKSHLDMLVIDSVNGFNKKIFNVCDLFSYFKLDNKVLKMYNQAWKFSHEFFHSLDKCCTALQYNSKFSYIENKKRVSNNSLFEYICKLIIEDCTESKVSKFFIEKILGNDKDLEADFIEYLTNIKFLNKFNTDYNQKKNYHTLYMFKDFDSLQKVFSDYNTYSNLINDTKNYVFYLYFFEKFNDYNSFNDINLKKKLDNLRKEINNIGDILPKSENGEKRGKIVEKLKGYLFEYYNSYKNFKYNENIDILCNSIFSKSDVDLIKELNNSYSLSKFAFQGSLYYLIVERNKCEGIISKLKPELNLSEFFAESFPFSHLPDVFHDGPASFTSCYFKYLDFVHISYLKFSENNNKNKCLFDEYVEMFK